MTKKHRRRGEQPVPPTGPALAAQAGQRRRWLWPLGVSFGGVVLAGLAFAV